MENLHVIRLVVLESMLDLDTLDHHNTALTVRLRTTATLHHHPQDPTTEVIVRATILAAEEEVEDHHPLLIIIDHQLVHQEEDQFLTMKWIEEDGINI